MDDSARDGQELVLRGFEASDEADLRRICFRTLLYGRPGEALLGNPGLVTDLLLLPYLRFERGLLSVACLGSRVAGYLCGCADTRRLDRLTSRHVVPGFLARAILGHLQLKVPAPRLLYAAMRHLLTARRHLRPIVDAWPGHLHINLDESARGRGVGTALLDRFVAQARAAGVPALHASVASEGGRAFFTRSGFRPLRAFGVPSLLDGHAVEVQLMGRRLDGGNTP